MTNEEDFECLADLCRRHKFRDPEQAAEELLEIRRQYFEDELVGRFLPLTEHLDKICDELESLEPEAKAQLAASITLHITPRNPVDAADAFIEAVKAVRSFVARRNKPKEPSVGRPPETRRDVLLASLALFHERHAGVPFRESRNDTRGGKFVSDAATTIDRNLSLEGIRAGMRSVGRWMSSSGPGLAADRRLAATDDGPV